ncbi:MAG: hypothetical protein WC052_01140 [Patescibacteria group bacterium]
MRHRNLQLLLSLFFFGLLPAVQSSLFGYYAMPPLLPLFSYAGLLFLPTMIAVIVGILGATWYDIAFSLPTLTSVASVTALLLSYIVLSRLLTGSTFVAAHARALVSYVSYSVVLWVMSLVSNRVYPNGITGELSILGSIIGYVLLASLVELVRRRQQTEQLSLPFFQR